MIIALREKSRIYFASDSIHTEGKKTWFNKTKIWKHEANPHILMGGEGDLFIVQQVKESIPFIPDVPTEKNVTEFLHGLMTTYKTESEWSFLIGGNGKIFLIKSNGLIIEAPIQEAIGPEREIALSLLDVTIEEHENPEYRLRLVLGTAMKYSPTIGGEINIQMV